MQQGLHPQPEPWWLQRGFVAAAVASLLQALPSRQVYRRREDQGSENARFKSTTYWFHNVITSPILVIVGGLVIQLEAKGGGVYLLSILTF
jgi:hypothetical protein